MSDEKFVILDFETTGANITENPDKKLGYFKGKKWYDPIELALIDLSSGKEYHWFIKPHKDYLKHKWATEIHGYEPNQFMDRDDLHEFKDIYGEVSRILTGKTAVAHNAFRFDKEVMIQTCEKYNLLQPLCKWRDTKQEVKKRYPDMSATQEDIAKWMFKEEYKAHSALEDVRMLSKIFKKLNETPAWIFV